MKINYIVNYGPDWGHRGNNSEVFERYKEAKDFYYKIMTYSYGAGEIVGVSSDSKYSAARIKIKRQFNKNGICTDVSKNDAI